MDQIELERHEYADRDPKTDKWRRPQSKRSAKWWLFFACVFLVALFLVRTSSASEFALEVMIAFFAGVFASNWLRDIY